jgi:membrane protein implicated in regulation of membrane protease activity
MRAPGSTPLVKYLLLQVPGWAGLGLVLWLLQGWLGLPIWALVTLMVVWLIKDLALYPLLRPAYEEGPDPIEALVGRHGTAEQPLTPTGYVRVRGELWQAEVVRPHDALARGTRIVVEGTRGTILLVRPATPHEPF